MSDVPLPRERYGTGTYITALEELVNRYDHEQEPIHYEKAATDIPDTTSSSCLRYFSEIGLIEKEKAGVYVPTKPAGDFFNKIGQSRENAVEGIHGILIDYDVFQEVTYHLDEEGAELNEAARKTVGGLNLDKDTISDVERAIEIFHELEQVSIDQDGLVYPADVETPEAQPGEPSDSETEAPESVETGSGIIDPEAIDPEEIELSPTRGDPESIRALCRTLRAGGTWTIDDLVEETEFAARTLRGHLRYGEELGFIKRSDDGITNTQQGYDLGFEEKSNEKTQQLFLHGVLNSEFYIALLHRCLDRSEQTNEGIIISRTHCERELRTHFSFTEESETTLGDAINTFLQTIEATGYGNYVVGRGGKETRIVLSENDVDALKRTIRVEITEDPAQDPTEEPEQEPPEDEPEIEDENDDLVEQPVIPEKPEDDGPALRISSFQIRNYRNLQDTGEVRLEPLTTFIGKNESGKTSTLEAINSFQENGEYPDRDICHAIDYEFKQDLPIISLTFEITEEIAQDHYSEDDLPENFPIEYRVTKYADGHVEEVTDLDISPPSPDIVYYNDYSLISDVLHFDEEEDKQSRTFLNLLKIGDLTEEDITETKGREHHQAIENAQNQIEQRLNDAWSQKDVEVKLPYSDGENCLRLYIQDHIQDEERGLTEPSLRSEGFQWFFSFFVNMLAEIEEEGQGHKILLLDDPAVHLHPEGKQDWLKSLEEIAREEQVLYTSHSPYLIEKQYPARIRTVQDTPDGTKGRV